MTRGEFYEACCIFCEHFQGSQTSGFRSRRRNLQAETAKARVLVRPPHRYGYGLDVTYDPDPIPEEADAKRFAESLSLRLVREGDHDHLQPAWWVPG